MRSFKLSFSLNSLLVLCLAVGTLPSLNAQCMSEAGCQSLTPRSESVSSLIPELQSSKETNAERLSRGLPLLPPTRRSTFYFQILPAVGDDPSHFRPSLSRPCASSITSANHYLHRAHPGLQRRHLPRLRCARPELLDSPLDPQC